MIEFLKQDGKYYFQSNGQELGWIELYDNPNHT